MYTCMSYRIILGSTYSSIQGCNIQCNIQMFLVQPIPLGVTFSTALSKLKAQSSNVSFHWNVAKETFELWALSFRKWHPKWDWLYLYTCLCTSIICNVHSVYIYVQMYVIYNIPRIYMYVHRVAKTHRMPHLYKSFSAQEPYNWWLFCETWPAT